MNGLVLSGGGARAAYQVGVLSYIADHAPEVTFPILTGVSAGAINAAFLAGHKGSASEALGELADAWGRLRVDRVFRADLGSLALSGVRWAWTLGGGGTSLGPTVKGLLNTAPLHEFLTDCLPIDGIQANVTSQRLRALGLTATSYTTGQTITFVHGPEDIPTWQRVRRCGTRTQIGVDHVMASGAIPLIFPASCIDGDYYGDGSIRQAAPLAPAIHLGADRLLAIATRYASSTEEAKARAVSGYPPPAQVISMLFNSIFLDTLDADAERLERLNQVLAKLPPDASHPGGLRQLKLLVIRPSCDLATLAVEHEKRLPRSVRFVLRGLGTHRVRRPDLLSYLMFDDPYVGRLIDLGYEDARAQWGEIERFFSD